jgi:hypothetical protein
MFIALKFKHLFIRLLFFLNKLFKIQPMAKYDENTLKKLFSTVKTNNSY